jgi:esterase/lipase
MNSTRTSLKGLFKPSGLNDRFQSAGLSFPEYIEQMRSLIKKGRIDLDNNKKDWIIEANTPFQWIPRNPKAFNTQTGKLKNGVLLIHGLFEAPYSMRNLSLFFKNRQFLVRSILLPGHGTVPGDLLNVHYDEWIKAVQYGIDSFSGEVENLFLCGFSLGGLLCLNQALEFPHTFRSLILLAPAYKLRTHIAWATRINLLLAKMLPHFQWFNHISPNLDLVRYQSVSCNAAKQILLLSQKVQDMDAKGLAQTPLFMVISADDELIAHTPLISFFNQQAAPQSRLLYYTNKALHFNDPRIILLKSHFADKRVLDLSHICLPIAPDDPYYSHSHGLEELPLAFYPNVLKSKKYLTTQQTFSGALTVKNLRNYPLKRLLCNPDFYNMTHKLSEFIDNL